MEEKDRRIALKLMAKYIQDDEELEKRLDELEKIRKQFGVKNEWPVKELTFEYDGNEAWGTFGIRELRQMSPKKMQDVVKIVQNTIDNIDKVLEAFKRKYPDVKILKDW